MKRHLGFVFALLLLAVAPACAVAATWSLGPNIGFSMLSGQNSTQTVIAWPGDVSGYMPGLRIGYFKKGAPSEFFFDTGLSYLGSNGNSFRVLQGTANMQFNLARRSTEIRISGGCSDTDMNAFAVMPWIWSSTRVAARWKWSF